MYPKLLHIYGPLYLNSFGVMIALGLALFYWCAQRHQLRKANLSRDAFTSLLLTGALVGWLGGRIAFIITHYEHFSSLGQMLAIWKGGFAVLGGVLAVLTIMPLYMRLKRIPILPLLDLAALYAPLMQSVARIGCFLAGCCYGLPTASMWGVTYTHADCIAPLHIALHPTQLYSSLIYLLIFLLVRYAAYPTLKRPGQLAAVYLMLASAERFALDILRAERYGIGGTPGATLYHGLTSFQWVAFAIFCAAGILFIMSSHKGIRDTSTRQPYESI